MRIPEWSAYVIGVVVTIITFGLITYYGSVDNGIYAIVPGVIIVLVLHAAGAVETFSNRNTERYHNY